MKINNKIYINIIVHFINFNFYKKFEKIRYQNFFRTNFLKK